MTTSSSRRDARRPGWWFPAVVYIVPATRAATNSGSPIPWSSSLAALYGTACNSADPGRVRGPAAEGRRQGLHRVGDWLTSPVHRAWRNARGCKKITLWSGKSPKGQLLGVLQRHWRSLVLGSCRDHPQPPSPTSSIGFCVIWVSISSSSNPSSLFIPT